MRYTSYHLSIDCPFPLPELLPDESGEKPADIHIRLATVPPEGLRDGRQVGPLLWTGDHSLWLNVPEVARFLVRHGREILIDPAPGIDEDSLRVFLLGSALGSLLFQRGLLVLHGNAIRVGDQCMLCLGGTGTGKSTLAAGFLARGHQVLADDVVAVDNECRALPGFPRIKLWQDAADQLSIDTESLRRIRPDMRKFNYPVQPAPESLPIRWIYILGGGVGDDIRLEPIQGMDRFEHLKAHTYRARFMEGMALKTRHLQLCGQLAGRARLAWVARPTDGFHLDDLAEYLLTDMSAHP